MDIYSRHFSLKSSLEDIFGRDAWHQLKETTDVLVWKKYITKTLKALDVASKQTVLVYDNEWREDLTKIINDGLERIKTLKDIDELISELANTLLKISFLQIGYIPNRKRVNGQVTLKKENWKLDKFRTVLYAQTSEQKDNLFKHKQQKQVGFHRQNELLAEYRRSKSKLSYSQWCYTVGITCTDQAIT